jgi:hypothetical protein
MKNLDGYRTVLRSTDLIQAMTINPDIKYKLFVMPESQFIYCIAFDVLKDPELFKQLLEQYPIYDSKEGHMVAEHIGAYRQRFSPKEFEPILQVWSNAMNRIYNQEILFNAYDWQLSTSTYIVGLTETLPPHHDYPTIAANLYLSEHMEKAGTAFYKLKMDGEVYYNYSSIPSDKLDRFNEIDRWTLDQKYPWKPYEPNEFWEVYHVIPGFYNTAYIVDGDYFHHGIYDEQHWDENNPRKTLVSFKWNR